MGCSRELGLAVQGAVGPGGEVSYHVMLGNGSGVRSDDEPGKKLLLSVGFHPLESLLFEVYADWDHRTRAPGDARTWTPGREQPLMPCGCPSHRIDKPSGCGAAGASG